MNADLIYLYTISVITFALYAWDKHLAVYKKQRIPEALLLFMAAVGGAFGALCAMLMFRHKTQHTKFTVCVPIFLFVTLAVDILLRLFVFK